MTHQGKLTHYQRVTIACLLSAILVVFLGVAGFILANISGTPNTYQPDRGEMIITAPSLPEMQTAAATRGLNIVQAEQYVPGTDGFTVCRNLTGYALSFGLITKEYGLLCYQPVPVPVSVPNPPTPQ